jgi:hypothetical protein
MLFFIIPNYGDLWVMENSVLKRLEIAIFLKIKSNARLRNKHIFSRFARA